VPPSPPGAPPPRPANAGEPKKPLRALLVEDSETDAELLLRALKTGGYDVTYQRVESKREMKNALGEQSWEIILSDYSLPQFSAPEALKTLKETGIDIPFIIVSGTIGEDIAVDAMKNGAHDFMVKGRLARLGPAIERELRDVETRRQRREAEEGRRASDARFRAIMEAASEAVVAADDAGQIQYVNPAAERTFGYASGELLGKSLGELMPETFKSGVARFVDARKDSVIGRSVELVGQRKDLGEFPLELSLGSWSSSDRVYFAGIIRDLTERKKVEAQLMMADRMVAVGSLAAGVAHEINNPLAAILANLELALSDLEGCQGELAPDVANVLNEELRDARDAGERVRKIVRDLRIFSRSEQDQPSSVDVESVMESSLRMAHNEIRHRAKVVRNYSPVPPVLASESRLGQVFLNLVVNAAQAMVDGQANVNEVRVSTRLEGKRVVIELADTGPGIPPQVMKQLFAPFITTKPAGIGTGLGLSICQRIISGFGGEISATNLAGRGACFRIALPVAATAPISSVRPPTAVSPAPRRGRVLVVDDEPLVATVVSRVLSAEHEVVALNRAKDALDRVLAGEHFDVILCDLMMPEFSGMDFYQELRARAPEQVDGLVFITGGAFSPSARRFLDDVSNARLEKPFDPDHLRTLINDRVR
jgi:PAS domain S-box-containing protein